MTNPLCAAYYADRAIQLRASVLENVPTARDTFRLRFAAPELARRIVPGQFVMLRLAVGDDPLLARPLALYDTVLSPAGEPIGLDIVYLVLGKMTARLAQFRPGEQLEVWGPLGNGFTPAESEHLIMVAGGIGQTPFPAVARECLGLRTYGDPPRPAARVRRITLCYGARSEAYLSGLEDFERLGVRVRISTDDGSRGQAGLVTALLETELASATSHTRIVCCGPEPMMATVGELARAAEVPCEVSLETPMACGIGICFSCVTKVRDEQGGWDYKRTCVEGPVFDAERIVW